jgi:hypothetical protein
VAIHTGDPNRNFYSDKVMARAGAGLASGTSLQVTVPPMAQSVGFVVRAQDEVGNVSTIDATATVSTEWTREAVANPGNGFTGNTSFGAVVSEVADLNGDNILDVITSSPGGFNNTSNPVSGQVHILYGGGSGFRRQTFTAPATATSQFFGADVTVGNVAGPSGRGVGQDLVVGASNFGSNAGRAYLYVGGESAGDLDTSNPYVLEGEAGLAGRFARSVHVLPDLDGDGFRELAVSAPNLDNTTPGGGVKQGRVYLYRGGTEADWTAKVTGSVSGTRGSIPASAADCVINGPTPVANSSTNTQPNNFFGEQMGWLNLPDLDGDGRAEVALPASSDSTGRVFVFSGETLRACMDADGTLSATTDAVQVLSASANLLSNAANSGFGQYCASGDVLGSSSAELLVSHPTRPASEIGPDGTNSGQGRVEIFSTSGDNAAPWTTPSVQVIEYTGSSGAVFASGVALGNFQSGGSARTDIVVGHRSASSAEGGVWFFSRNLGGTGTAYDTKASAGFRQGFVVAPTGTAMGTNVVVGDFTGDGLLDIVATDSSTAAGGNRVYLWH